MSLIYTNKDIVYQNPEDINETEVKTGLTRQAKIRWGERFLKGPIPLRDIAAAALLPGKSLALFLVVHHQIALTGKPFITLPAALLRDFGISRSTKARCLKALENANVVSVTRSRGRAAKIKLKNKNIGEKKCGQS